MGGNIFELAVISLFIRLVGAFFFGAVIYRQLKLRRGKHTDGLNTLRNAMIALAVVPFLYNFVAIYNNSFRVMNKRTNDTVNNISFPLSAIASTSTAVLLWSIYAAREED